MRELTDAERRSDLLAINRLLNGAKDDLEQQVSAAQRTAISRWLAGQALTIRITRRMLRLLLRLYRSGQSHALSEALKMGVKLENPVAPTAHASTLNLPGTPAPPQLLGFPDGMVPEEPVRILRVELEVLSRKVASDALDMAFGISEERENFVRALRERAGSRNVAAQVVGPAFHDGLASVFVPNHERFDGWQYSALLDSKACGPCVDDDGRVFSTIAEALSALPRFGGNPRCLGGTRCRCRLHPVKPLRLAA